MHAVVCDSQPMMEDSSYSITVAIIVVVIIIVVIVGVIVGLIIFVRVYQYRKKCAVDFNEAKDENKKVT